MKQMRVTGASRSENIFVQTLQKGAWIQERMTEKDFTDFIKSNYTKYFEEYLESNTKKSIIDYFYDYGTTEEMLRTGEAYVFTA